MLRPSLQQFCGLYSVLLLGQYITFLLFSFCLSAIAAVLGAKYAAVSSSLFVSISLWTRICPYVWMCVGVWRWTIFRLHLPPLQAETHQRRRGEHKRILSCWTFLYQWWDFCSLPFLGGGARGTLWPSAVTIKTKQFFGKQFQRTVWNCFSDVLMFSVH